MTWANVVYWLIGILAAWQETAVCGWIVDTWHSLVMLVTWQPIETAALAGIGYLCAMATAVVWWCWRRD